MKKIVCCISCVAIIGISVFYAGRLLQPNFTVDAFHAIESFHSMPENSFDVIACGSSHVYKGLLHRSLHTLEAHRSDGLR